MATLSKEAAEYLSQFDARLLATPAGRRILTRLNPRLFALVYLRHHLSGADTGSVISFSEAQLDWYDQMTDWVAPVTVPRAWRRAYVSPRASAKSTTWFLIAPLWAAAHGHQDFIAAFADSATQAEGHLATFKAELETNELLRKDFPELCTPMRRERGTTTFDNRSMIQQKNGFVFAARGVDSASLGLKVGEKRPSMILLDDIEPSESNYSAAQVEKRLSTVTNAILPLSEYARVVLVGTVTMEGSLIHQLVKVATTQDPVPAWIKDENFKCYYYPAILTNDDGSERSLWSEKWSLEFLQSIRHTRSFMLNYMNKPMAQDGIYWAMEDIKHCSGSVDAAGMWTIISVDPAVTSSEKSDYTGISVMSFDKSTKKLYVRYAVQVKLSPADLRKKIQLIMTKYPEASRLLIETNQGGDVWKNLFHGLDIKYIEKKQTIKKELRARHLSYGYQLGNVIHETRLPDLEEQMIAFPNVKNDDLIDAVGTGYMFFTPKEPAVGPTSKPGALVGSYK